MHVQVGMDARSLAARLPSRRHDGAAGQSEARKGQTDRGAKNAQQRRLRAFRQSLVRAVVPSHQAFLNKLRQDQQQQQQQQQCQQLPQSALCDVPQPRPMRQQRGCEGLQRGRKASGELGQQKAPAGEQGLNSKKANWSARRNVGQGHG